MIGVGLNHTFVVALSLSPGLVRVKNNIKVMTTGGVVE